MRILSSLVFLSSLMGLGFMAPAAKASDPVCIVAADHPLIGEKRWYGLYYEDRKIGHAVTEMTLEPPESGTADPQTIIRRFAMTLKLEQAEETIEEQRRFEAVPPHRLIDGVYNTTDRRIAYEQRDDGLVLREDGLSRRWPDVDRNLCDEEDMAVHRFLESAPPIGAQLETTDVDVEHQVLMMATHHLEDVSTRRILGADHVFQTLHTTSSNEIFPYNARALFRNGEAVSHFLGPIEFRAETEAIAHQPNQGVDLFAEFEKPLNRPLSRLSSIEQLTLRARIEDPDVTIGEVVRDGYGQRVAYEDDQTAIIRIAGQPAPPETVEAAAFLRPTSTHPADHPRLQVMAASIAEPLGARPGERALAEAILDFVAGYIEIVPESPYAYHTTSVFDILDNRTGDCTEHSQLFVTLARAAGLPAREVSGFVYGGDDGAPSLGGHAWVEVLIDGRWIGMDPTWNETELNRSHVQTRNTLVPSLAFEVVDITYR